ncbi:MAG: ribosomal-protein-alanine N-acetyltransferase [Rhodocyclaceae bacterium]|nr:MAG: ribosomal-protein-alanine N-acetyltransferase [Rhodocyclaceae bacterium]
MRESDLDEVAPIEARNYEFPWTRGNLADSLAAGHSAWVLRNGGGMQGYAVLMRVLDEAHLLNITIDLEWRGTGRGRQLLADLCEMSREAGARQFFLEVRPSNTAALALYQSAGFTRVGLRRGYYPARDGREDAIVMVKPL